MFDKNTVLFGESTVVFGANTVIFWQIHFYLGSYSCVLKELYLGQTQYNLGANWVLFGLNTVIFGAITVAAGKVVFGTKKCILCKYSPVLGK